MATLYCRLKHKCGVENFVAPTAVLLVHCPDPSLAGFLDNKEVNLQSVRQWRYICVDGGGGGGGWTTCWEEAVAGRVSRGPRPPTKDAEHVALDHTSINPVSC